MIGSLFSASIDAEVYKWVDKDGNVHFSDKPIDEKSQIVKVPKPLTKAQQDAAKAIARKAIQMHRKKMEIFSEEKREAAEKKKEKQAVEKKLSLACNSAKDDLSMFEAGAITYQLDETGQRVFHDKEAQQKKIAKLKDIVKELCK